MRVDGSVHGEVGAGCPDVAAALVGRERTRTGTVYALDLIRRNAARILSPGERRLLESLLARLLDQRVDASLPLSAAWEFIEGWLIRVSARTE